MDALTPHAVLTRLAPEILAGGLLLFGLAASVLARPLGRAVERLDRPRAARRAVAIGVALYVLWLGAGSLSRHWRLETQTYDLGNVEQAVWNTLHGDFFRMTTDPEFEMNLQHGTRFPDLPDSRWAFHVEPILLAVLPLYALAPRPETLLLIQTLLLGLGAIPAFLAARRALGRRAYGVAFAWLYLLNPNLHAANLFDVHPFVFAVPFLLGAWALADAGRPRAAFVCALAALACREDVAAPVAALGVLWLAGRHRALGAATLLAAIAWGALVFGWIMPHVNPHGSIFAKRLVMADSPAALARLALEKPGFIPWFLTQPPRLAYETYLLLPFGFTPLAAAHLLLLAAPSFFTIVFSSHDASRLLRGLYHYHAILVPGLLLASATGLAWMSGRAAPATRERLRAAALVAMLGLTLGVGAAWRDPALAPPRLDRARLAAVEHAKRLIPAHATVAASYVLGPHVAERRDLYTLYAPRRAGAQYVFLATCEADGCDGMPKSRYDAQLAKIRADPAYRAVFEEAGIILLRRSR